MSQRLYLPREQVFTDLGAIGAGWKLNSYEVGTTTPLATYSDTALTTPNTNPLLADSAGRLGDMFIDDAKDYKLVLTDENDVTIWTADPVDPKTFTLNDFDPRPTSFWGTTGGTSSAYTLIADPIVSAYSSNQTFFLDFHIACAAGPSLTYVSGGSALNIHKSDGSGGTIALEANDVLTGTYEARNNGTNIIILNPELPYFDGRNLTQATSTVKSVSYLPKQIIVSNGADTSHDLDNTAGNFQFSDGTGQAELGALTKRIDASWVAGSGNGGLFTGVVANDTTYFYFAIYNPATGISDAGFDTDINAANAPAGFTKYRKLSSVTTDSSGNIRNGVFSFHRDGGFDFDFTTPIEILTTSSPSGTNVLLPSLIPVSPNIKAHILCVAVCGTSSGDVLRVVFDGSDVTLNNAAYDIRLVGDAARYSSVPKSCLSSDGNIKYSVISESGNTILKFYIRGWSDNNL